MFQQKYSERQITLPFTITVLPLSGSRFGNAAYRHINIGNAVPGGEIHDSAGRQVKNPLERPHCLCRGRAENPIGRHSGNGGIIPADTRKPRLDCLDIKPGAADLKGGAGIGGEHTCLDVSLCDLNIFRIIGAQDFQRTKSLFCQRDSPPLGQAGTGGCRPVAEGGKVGRKLSFSPDILVKNSIHNLADGIIDWPAIYKILVIGGAVCDVKPIIAAAIPFRI